MEGGVLLHSLLALSCTDVGNAARDVRVHIPPVGGERDLPLFVASERQTQK